MSKTVCDWESTTSIVNPRYSQLNEQIPQSRLRNSYRVIIQHGQDGWLVARCLDVKGAISQGKTNDEALRNIIEAISAVLEETTGQESEFTVIWEEK